MGTKLPLPFVFSNNENIPLHGYKQISNDIKFRKCHIDLRLFSKTSSIFQFCSSNSLCDNFITIHKRALNPTPLSSVLFL